MSYRRISGVRVLVSVAGTFVILLACLCGCTRGSRCGPGTHEEKGLCVADTAERSPRAAIARPSEVAPIPPTVKSSPKEVGVMLETDSGWSKLVSHDSFASDTFHTFAAPTRETPPASWPEASIGKRIYVRQIPLDASKLCWGVRLTYRWARWRNLGGPEELGVKYELDCTNISIEKEDNGDLVIATDRLNAGAAYALVVTGQDRAFFFSLLKTDGK